MQPTESAHSSSIKAGGLHPTTRWPKQVGSIPQLPSMHPSSGPSGPQPARNSCMLASPSSPALPRFSLRRCRHLPIAPVCFSASFCPGLGSTGSLPPAAEVFFGKAHVIDACTRAAALVNPSAARMRRSASLLNCMATPAAEWTTAACRGWPGDACGAGAFPLVLDCVIYATTIRLTSKVY